MREKGGEGGEKKKIEREGKKGRKEAYFSAVYTIPREPYAYMQHSYNSDSHTYQ